MSSQRVIMDHVEVPPKERALPTVIIHAGALPTVVVRGSSSRVVGAHAAPIAGPSRPAVRRVTLKLPERKPQRGPLDQAKRYREQVKRLQRKARKLAKLMDKELAEAERTCEALKEKDMSASQVATRWTTLSEIGIGTPGNRESELLDDPSEVSGFKIAFTPCLDMYGLEKAIKSCIGAGRLDRKSELGPPGIGNRLYNEMAMDLVQVEDGIGRT
ncbi:hypothetical protein BJ138DRAFT_1106101 [Hygrophoropsis aurantiaca]|uniref:Uncharacterized protein n=1 Tax=Hygrophoropsis aurantiaca TaxID=72124 RepID=A0ACB7ZW87_9AGAM|nr:hypothetical protein BJ138DRAFT_1106101 [Hygrophoropsis aurantiaca]